MLKTVCFGPKDHGRLVGDVDLQAAEFRSGYDYEVIYGRLYVSPTPDFEHDWIEKHVFGQVYLYSRQHPEVIAYVTDRARVFVPGTDKTTAPEPDLAVYAKLPSGDWRNATPLIVGEVLSGANVDKDLFRNVDLYLRVPSKNTGCSTSAKMPSNPCSLFTVGKRTTGVSWNWISTAFMKPRGFPGSN